MTNYERKGKREKRKIKVSFESVNVIREKIKGKIKVTVNL